MPDAEHYQVSTTTDSQQAATALARSAVTARVAACGQVIGPVESVYWWQGMVDTAAEWLVLLKTAADQREALVEHLRAAHSYDVPEIICTPVTGGNPAYLAWLREETRSR